MFQGFVQRNEDTIVRSCTYSAARGEERNKQDVTFCLQLFNKGMHLGLAEDDFINVFRLGRINESGAPRPLMVQLASYNIKNLIMESLYKLRHAEQKYRSVVVAHHMTKTECEECKKLVMDAKSTSDQDTSGEYLYRVRGLPGDMKILKLKKKELRNNNELDKLGILYTNADGLVNTRQELKLLINSFQIKPDIIAITEINPKNISGTVVPSEFNLDGYNVYCQGLSDKYHRGLLVYVASYLEASVVNVPDTFSESMFLVVKFAGTPNRLLFGNIYRSPNGSY